MLSLLIWMPQAPVWTQRASRSPERDSPHSLDFDSRAGFGELLLDVLGFFLVDAFLDRFGRAIDQILSFLQTQVRDFAHGLDDVDLVRSHRGKHDRELGLLFRRCRSRARSRTAAGHHNRSRGSRRDAKT